MAITTHSSITFEALAPQSVVTIEKFFTALLGTFTTVGGVVFLIYFLLGALSWLTSQGEPEKVAKAQRYITNAIVGLVVIIASWAIVSIIGSIFGFQILNLSGNLFNIYIWLEGF